MINCHGKLVLPQKEENEAITSTTPFDSSQWASYKCAIDWESHKNSMTSWPQKMHNLSNEWSIKWTIHFKDSASSVANWPCYGSSTLPPILRVRATSGTSLPPTHFETYCSWAKSSCCLTYLREMWQEATSGLQYWCQAKNTYAKIWLTPVNKS